MGLRIEIGVHGPAKGEFYRLQGEAASARVMVSRLQCQQRFIGLGRPPDREEEVGRDIEETKSRRTQLAGEDIGPGWWRRGGSRLLDGFLKRRLGRRGLLWRGGLERLDLALHFLDPAAVFLIPTLQLLQFTLQSLDFRALTLRRYRLGAVYQCHSSK